MAPVISSKKRRFFMLDKIQFDPKFGFGACSAPWQVENAVYQSNWSLFENQKKEDGTPCAPPHLRACDAIEQFDTDLQNIQTMNLKQYRFGLSWSALNPKSGEFDSNYLQNYISQVHKLKAAGIEPIVTLWHFEIPAWLEEQGGLLSPDFVSHFMKFVRFAATPLANDVKIWLTVNEPALYALFAYVTGEFPPGHHMELKNFFRALSSLMKAHAEAYRFLHSLDEKMKVSFPQHIIPFVPVHRWSAIECGICAFANQFNYSVLEAVETGTLAFSFCYFNLFQEKIPNLKDSIDFIAVNHYMIDFISISPFDWESLEKPLVTSLPKLYDHSDFGWGLVPDSLADSMNWVHTNWNPKDLPMIVSEHGISDGKDTKRERFIVDSLGYLGEAVNSGVPVVGYLYWSLTDNYEWAAGYSQRFGLVSVDFETQERKIRNSAKTIAKIAAKSTGMVL